MEIVGSSVYEVITVGQRSTDPRLGKTGSFQVQGVDQVPSRPETRFFGPSVVYL